MQCQPRDQRALFFAEVGTIIPFEPAQKNPRSDARQNRVVERIDRQRQANGFQMHPNLVRSAGPGIAAEQCESPHPPFDFPAGDRRLAMLGDGHAIAFARMRGERQFDFPLALPGLADNDGEIFLLHQIILKLMGKMPLGVDVFRHQQHAAGVFIEPMHDTQPRVGLPAARQPNLPGQHFQQTRLLAPPGDGRQSRGLGDGENLPILKEARQIYGFRRELPVDHSMGQFYYRTPLADRASPTPVAIGLKFNGKICVRSLIAVPVFNEKQHVDHVLDRILKNAPDEVLVVDDGSTDGTGDILAARSDIQLIRHPINRGYGQSLIDAFCFADRRGYDWVITMDCDEQHEPERIPDFLPEIESDRWDLISGSRYLKPQGDDDLPPADRRSINMTITTILNELFNLNITDAFCGFKAHRVSAMRRLRLDVPGYAFPIQLWPQVATARFRLTEIPVRLIYNDPNRHFGGSLDDAGIRLRHYLDVLNAEVIRLAENPLPPVENELTEPAFCNCQ